MLYPQSAGQLLKLYDGLIKDQGMTVKQLHPWREDGTLIENIKAVYEAVPPESRGKRYTWFLEQLLTNNNDFAALIIQWNQRLWNILGPNELLGEIPDNILQNVMDRFDIKITCWNFYLMLFEPCLPSLGTPFWILFGFCACPTGQEQLALAEAY